VSISRVDLAVLREHAPWEGAPIPIIIDADTRSRARTSAVFIYPDSRVQLRDLIIKAELGQDIVPSVQNPGLYILASYSAPTHGGRTVSVQFFGAGGFWESQRLDLEDAKRGRTRRVYVDNMSTIVLKHAFLAF
jgi:hypothetical protein